MQCSSREGTKFCIWWTSGCLNPHVEKEVKEACVRASGQLGRPVTKPEPIALKG